MNLKDTHVEAIVSKTDIGLSVQWRDNALRGFCVRTVSRDNHFSKFRLFVTLQCVFAYIHNIRLC